MARKNANGVNKSEAVREMLSQDPKVQVKDVVEALAAKDIVVQPSLVYALKAKMKVKKRRQVREQAAVAIGNGDPVTLIKKVKALALESGGIRKLKALVEVLAE